MKHVNTFLALIAGLAFATTACVKVNEINEMYRPAGTPIVFSASSGYQNGIETRAEYSGFVTTDHLTGTTNNYERIDWEKDDPIKIVYNGTTAEFKVNNEITPENEVSKAGVVALGDPLYWTDATTHTFYGLYPNKNGASLSTAGVVSNCVIPKDQDVSTDHTITVGEVTKFQPNTDDYGYMVAYKQISADDTDTTVELPFRPAVTTFEFKLQHVTGNADLKVTKFTLTTEAVSGSTTPLTGKFSLPITSGDKRGADIVIGDVSLVSGSTGNIIEVDMPEGGVILPAAGATGYLDFSVIALPVDLTGISLNVYYEDGSHKTLKFQSGGNWVKFDGARKYLITNVDVPNGEWEYIIEPIPSIQFVGHNAVSDIPFNVKSYKRSKSNHDYKVEVKWHIEYSTDGNTYSESGGHPDFMLSGLPESASGSGNYTTGENRASNIIRPNPNHNDATSDADLISRQALQNATPKGTSASDCYDLSMFDVYGNPHAQTTANSYVVSAPGWYKFPVVYGNAITNGSDNKSAYDPYASDAPLKDHWNWVWGTYDASHHDVYMTKHFYNALNQPITSPYVLEDVPASSPKAVLIWQDTDAGDEIIKYDSGELELIGSGSNAYIRFHIAKENIHQGNIVLAVRDGNGGTDQEVLWSWQIWVSEKDLTPITSKDLMPYNLGWVDKSGLTVQNYTNRVNYYRIVQDETGGTYKDFTITQIGDQNSIPNNNGYNTFYQWGRKDPITSAKLSGRTSQEYSAQLSTWTVEKIHFFPSTLPLYPDYNPPANGDYHSPSYALGIKRPWIPLHDPDNNGWVNGQFYPPLATFYHTSFLRGDPRYSNPHEAGVPHDGAQFRKMSGCPFNLWNSYAYSSDDFSDNKYKTVYDPCPPGFCVPSLGTFAGIESATLELDPGDTSSPLCNGINVIYSNGDSFFLPFSGTRGTRQVGTEIHYLVDDWGKRGVYWVDAPSALNKTNGWDSTNNNHGGGWWWYQFAKSLHVYYNIGSFPDEIDHTNYVKYSPEIGHWQAKAQPQKVGFDDVRSNAFSIRPVVDPMY